LGFGEAKLSPRLLAAGWVRKRPWANRNMGAGFVGSSQAKNKTSTHFLQLFF
jgi:hypothetical protein